MELRFTLDAPLHIRNQRPVWLSVPDPMPKPENLVYRDDDQPWVLTNILRRRFDRRKEVGDIAKLLSHGLKTDTC